MGCLTGKITNQQSLSVSKIQYSGKLLGDIQSPKLLYAHIDTYMRPMSGSIDTYIHPIVGSIYTVAQELSAAIGYESKLSGRCNLCCCIADYVSWLKEYVTIDNQLNSTQDNNLTSVFPWSINADSDNIEIIPKQGDAGIDIPITIRVNKINDSIDKTINVTAISKDRTASFVVIQSGSREKFLTADEQSLITSDEEIFGVLK